MIIISLVVLSVSSLNMNLNDRCLAIVSVLSTIGLLILPADMLEIYLIFEFTLLLLIPVLGSYSRAYRKVWAIITVLAVIIIGSALISVYIVNEAELVLTYFCWSTRIMIIIVIVAIS